MPLRSALASPRQPSSAGTPILPFPLASQPAPPHFPPASRAPWQSPQKCAPPPAISSSLPLASASPPPAASQLAPHGQTPPALPVSLCHTIPSSVPRTLKYSAARSKNVAALCKVRRAMCHASRRKPRCRVPSRSSGATPEDTRVAQGRSRRQGRLRSSSLPKFGPSLSKLPLPERHCRQSLPLPPLPPCASLFSSLAQPLPAIPAPQYKHRKPRKTSICALPQSANKSDDAGIPSLPRTCEYRGTAATPALSPPHRSAAARNTSATPHRASATAKGTPLLLRLVPPAPPPGNTARSISATRGESPRAPPLC